ncbi:dimethylsulfonioproprionate lyase family protein [Pseudophaeobacter sp.]|uniref:dimethylsulfonioproprionate lyase family protein n=1 Tax=Pseudophaeobacter sp. TaxID=1971739 RepID=UPI00329797B1
MIQNEIFQDMLEAISVVYEAEADPQGPHTAKTLVMTPSPASYDQVPPCLLDEGIRTVLANSNHAAARSVLRAQNFLPWGSNPVEGNTENSIAAMISVASLLGPEGPIPAPDVRLGLVYMQPESYYPLHLHDADETYAIIAGQALWTAGDDIRMRKAGDMIHHPSLMPHAFRTGAEGFLAIWRWSGDINTHSYAFIEDQASELQA